MRPQTMVVWKYNMGMDTKIEINMPQGAEFLHFENQRSVNMCIWMLVDPKAERMQKRSFEVFGTGIEIENPEKLNYLGTTLMLNDQIVMHLFERKL